MYTKLLRRKADVPNRLMLSALGLAASTTVRTLKEQFVAAGVLATPDSKIELVMVEDVQDLIDLCKEEGFPLVRGELPRACQPPMVKVPRRRYRCLLVAGAVALLHLPNDLALALDHELYTDTLFWFTHVAALWP